MKVSLQLAAISAFLLVSGTQAFQVCRTDWQDGNTCGYNCMNNDPVDATWCDNMKAAMVRQGANCWGDCHANSGAKFWCAKYSMNDPVCGNHRWNT
ncbi:hypothetical protein BGZ51_006226 [Haplosporangium sp. Z 767]|nr:hypothetical protein BGZ50_006278 [Haplosporangium sp. Z 11]KAF9180388.1 hypothetical protein BGZ51_006226 [Haplosporangium sp. Z 767]